jgi:hypothetical protein
MSNRSHEKRSSLRPSEPPTDLEPRRPCLCAVPTDLAAGRGLFDDGYPSSDYIQRSSSTGLFPSGRNQNRPTAGSRLADPPSRQPRAKRPVAASRSEGAIRNAPASQSPFDQAARKRQMFTSGAREQPAPPTRRDKAPGNGRPGTGNDRVAFIAEPPEKKADPPEEKAGPVVSDWAPSDH